jgi:hypothetical protein
MKPESEGPPKACGAEHPRYKGVTCVRIGQCWAGTPHMGIISNPRRSPDEQRRFIYWGGASLEMNEILS